MSPADFLRELLYPLRHLAVVLAIAVFGVALTLAVLVVRAGPVLAVVGAALSLLLLVALCRYGMQVLDDRANGRDPSAAGLEIFSIFDGAWRAFPVVTLLPVTWLGLYLDTRFGSGAAVLLMMTFVAVFPASLAVLAVTHSPLEAVNPAAIVRMVQACGPAYAAIPVVLVAAFGASNVFADAGLPLPADVILRLYAVLLLFTLRGAVAGRAGVAARIDIGAPAVRTGPATRSALVAEREKVANHAYGFVSRGNREGGFRHIREWIGRDPDPHAAVGWFFNEMMTWESTDAAQFFAQECFSHYLHHDMDAEALKLMSTCVYVNPRWRPAENDRAHAIELAERHGRGDLLASLRG